MNFSIVQGMWERNLYKAIFSRINYWLILDMHTNTNRKKGKCPEMFWQGSWLYLHQALDKIANSHNSSCTGVIAFYSLDTGPLYQNLQ